MSYWKDRVLKQEEILLDKSIDETEGHLIRLYQQSMRDTERDIKSLFVDLESEMMNGNLKINDLYRYNRYWEIRNQINQRLTELGHKQINAMAPDLENMYFKVQDYFNKNPKMYARTGKMVKPIDLGYMDLSNPVVSERANTVVNSVWCADGKYWSDRIWINMDILQQRLEQGLVDIITRGVNPTDVMKNIAQGEIVGEGYTEAFNRAERLVRTELSHIYNQAAIDRYIDAGCEYFEVLAAPDKTTKVSKNKFAFYPCADCEAMNGKIFSLLEAEEGENMPPFHPNCRCTIIPVIGGQDNA